MKLENPFKKIISKKPALILAIAALLGLSLLLLPQEGEAAPVQNDTAALQTAQQYCAVLEEKTRALINQLPNAKASTVAITLESGYRYIYATDQQINERADGKETHKTIVLAGNGNGENAILLEETMPKVSGIAVVCPKASYETQYKIVELLCALYNIPSNRISVQT